MFERYTEKARRVIFFARYQASQFGSSHITTEHVLLGLVREAHVFMSSWGIPNDLAVELRAAMPPAGEKISTSVDLPLTDAAMRVLSYSAEEAERLSHQQIGPEHLLLALLRESGTPAAEVLRKHGITAAGVRVNMSSWSGNEAIVNALRKTFAPMASRLTPEVEPAVTFSLRPGGAE